MQFFLMWLFVFVLVTLKVMYIHRAVTHRHCTFHPWLINFAKITVWLNQPKYYADWAKTWVAVHIIHHRYADQPDDPHSPYFSNFWDMMNSKRRWIPTEEIDRLTANIPETKITNLDIWLERHAFGHWVLLFVCLMLFQWWGLLVWTICRMQKFIHGLVNYFGHKGFGYNNNEIKLKSDRSRNLFGLGLVFTGEDLHGNHHRWPTRPSMAVRFWEFDIIYWFLKLLSVFKLVKFTKELTPVNDFQFKIER